jgi:secreted Zn-dependent insulinase-like peptidase
MPAVTTVFRETNYEFSIGHSALEDKIQRFASFLSHPVFNKKGILQQALSVQSEFQNYVQDDERRIANLDRYLSKSGDPWSAFALGNWETLTAAGKVPPSPGETDESGEWIDTLSSKLQEWYTKYYCGKRMHLVIIGSRTFDRHVNIRHTYVARSNRRADISGHQILFSSTRGHSWPTGITYHVRLALECRRGRGK